MPLTGEAKAEWRRKNRARIYAYTREWLESRLVAEPDYLDKQYAKAKALRPVRKCGCGAILVGNRRYCSDDCRPDRKRARLGRKTDGWGQSPHKAAERINNRTAHYLLTPIDLMAAKIARTLRLMSGRVTKGKPRLRHSASQNWEQAIARCVNNINRREESEWERKLATITESLNKRKDTHEQANQGDRHPQEVE
jgi:hypothetical protein